MTTVLDLNSYGRSVLKKRKLSSEEFEKFSPGAIIKVEVKNFVTYASTEFHLSPSLNMIIGPNGTGKSTFVCAVCLGLAGKPELLGRQKSLSEFIKNGEQSGSIKITLKNTGNRDNIVITREMFLTNKSDWYLNAVSTSEAKIKRLLQELNIQLDNLCQFLPQEKVADFAKLNTKELLRETERAIDSKLLDQHETLINLDKDKINVLSSLEGKERDLTDALEKRERLEESVRQYQLFQDKKAELETHEKLIPYAVIQDVQEKTKDLIKQRDKIKETLDNYEVEMPYTDAIANAESNLDALRNQSTDLKRSNSDYTERLTEERDNLTKLDEKRERTEDKIQSITKRVDKIEVELNNAITMKEQIKKELDDLDPYDPHSLEEIQQLLNQTNEDKYNYETEFQERETVVANIKRDLSRLADNINKTQDLFKSKDRLHILDNVNNPQARQAKIAIELLRGKLKSASSHVYEPACLTVTTSEPAYARYLEDLVDVNTSLALTASSKAAYDKISKELIERRNVKPPFRYLSNRNLSPKYTAEELNSFGFDGYLKDYLNGPADVIQMLSEVCFVHDVPVSKKPLSEQQIEVLKTPVNNQLRFRKFFAGDILYSLSVSRYGSRQVTLKTQRITENLRYFTAGGLSEDRRKELEGRINDFTTQRTRSEEALIEAKNLCQEAKKVFEEVQETFNTLNEQKRRLSQLKKEHESKRSKIDRFDQKIKQYERELKADNSKELARLDLRLKEIRMERLNISSRLVEIQSEFNNVAQTLTMTSIRILEEENILNTYKRLTKCFEEEKDQLKQDLLDVKRRIQDVKKTPPVLQARDEIKAYSTEEKEILTDLIQQYMETGTFTEDNMIDRVDSLKASLSLLGNTSRSSLSELERLDLQIGQLNEEIPTMRLNLKEKNDAISGIQSDWEPKLSTLVDKISHKFSSIFPTVGSAGQVRLAKAESFLDWKLEILVKFRDASELKVLDSHTQSGGERAVSTVYYMISLQELTSSPFRVVDEINQGMDARNEKVVHKHMVEVACQENTSQYFLITPKLLTGLHYADKMRVHCILAGPWTPNPTINKNYLSLGATSVYA
ncbi:hypothetical protein WICMUC_002779 [Wickerhamomyces mucosus]|uniref:Structural maintenance of chromosomes protein 5 n=1 Tax=Wickerhamomyces mucosus TaxID=1378264 RepID=A0A9P8TD60_9ASCO|nr:hypothetical protein WICMUC_002779 [Wickerhamomyces mucosus]